MSAFTDLNQALTVLRNRTGLNFALESGNGKRKLVLRSADDLRNEREYTGYWPASRLCAWIDAFIDGFEAGKDAMANELLYNDD